MENTALLSLFVASAPSATAMLDRDMRYLAASERWRQYYHLGDDLVGKYHFDLFPNVPDAWKANLNRAMEGETIGGERDFFPRADGANRWLRWQAQPWRRLNNDIGGIVIHTEDITERETQEDLTRRNEAALRALGDNLPDSLVYRFARAPDGQTRYLYVSAGVEKLFGVTAAQALANASTIFSSIPREHLPGLAEAIDISARDLSDFAMDVPVLRPDGETRWMRTRSRPFREPDGHIIWDGVATDVTEHVRMDGVRRELEQRNAYLLALADALKPMRDAAEIVAVASELLGRQIAAHQVAYAEVDDSETFGAVRREWSDAAMPSNLGVHRLADFGPDLIANLRRGEIVAIPDIREDPRTRSDLSKATFLARSILGCLCVPLVKGGKLAVILAIHQREPRPWSERDISLVEETAQRTWASIERRRAEEALRESEERFRLALSAAKAGAWEWDVATNKDVWSEDIWALYGLEPGSREPGLEAWLGSMHPDDRAKAARTNGLAAAQGGELSNEWRVLDANGEERWLLSRGKPIGGADPSALRYFGLVFDITERKRAEEKVRYFAHHDLLTGLPNRLTFNENLSSAIRAAEQSRTAVALLCMDLDRFKEVNDVFGHAVGDEILRQVATRLRAAGQGFSVARVGGDEFTAIVTGQRLLGLASELAESLIVAIAEPFEVDGQPIRIGLSVGAAFYPDHGDQETVLASADAALYRAKSKGGGNSCLFDSLLDNRLRERHSLQQDLDGAIERRELSLHYQPQIGADGEVFGFEALLRWRHPQRGMVPPNIFIPIAEESGLIGPIGEWVLREACREAASWARPLGIAVNLSPVQFLQEALVRSVSGILEETGLPGHRLELEITEGVFVHDFTRVSTILHQLKSLGVKVAMDDFGTGYSSLSYLQAFPFDKIKIDRSFVSSLFERASSQAIVLAIIGLGRGLRVPLIAEGVETQQQLDFLRAAGCEEAQGYLIGAPRPIEAYAAIVEARADAGARRLLA